LKDEFCSIFHVASLASSTVDIFIKDISIVIPRSYQTVAECGPHRKARSAG
jgi:hypothetical protein